MALIEYKHVDLTTGEIIETYLLDSETATIPENYIQGWGLSASYFDPVYDFDLQSWVEREPYENFVERARVDKDRELNDACNKAILAGFSHVIDGVTYWFSYDMEAQGNFRDAKEVLSDGTVTEIPWTVRLGGVDGEYSRIPITLPIIRELSIVIMNHKTEKISRYRDVLMPSVVNATKVEEVEAVKWEEDTSGIY